ncbi:MAG: LuxR C-terminal-related transcriptional regulator [Phormidesmis sp. CAN_BIN44]|nr:LuxR C-terminal-related transcriptional regulator [Phormidesmis sp. CAN_BIN44]
MTTPSDSPSVLLEFSNQLADTVERSTRSVVAVNARRKLSSTGVYWRSGIIVTADHTVSRDEEIGVTLPDGRSVPATLAGRDSSSDLALLKLENVDLPTIEISDSSALRIGQIVLAIARSKEGATSASMGVISTIGGAWRGWQGRQIDRFIRPSLMLHPGFSGSPLVGAIVAVAAGLTVLHPDVMETLLPVLPATTRPLPETPIQALTSREVEVLGMLAEGLGNKTIARRLTISEHTVKFHISSIFSKLNASSRTEAVILGARQGLIFI